jgi:NhaA family Na+:H+ antiporter
VASGLLVGKVVGISAATWLVVRTGVGRMPESCRPSTIVGLGLVGGVGFTVSLFVTALAFPDGSAAMANAKVAILFASTLSAVIGAAVLRSSAGRAAGRPAGS